MATAEDIDRYLIPGEQCFPWIAHDGLTVPYDFPADVRIDHLDRTDVACRASIDDVDQEDWALELITDYFTGDISSSVARWRITYDWAADNPDAALPILQHFYRGAAEAPSVEPPSIVDRYRETLEVEEAIAKRIDDAYSAVRNDPPGPERDQLMQSLYAALSVSANRTLALEALIQEATDAASADPHSDAPAGRKLQL